MKTAVSGQYIYFAMISALSGNSVVGIPSGNISGYRSTDGASGIALSGPVRETMSGTGLYAAYLFDWDTSGNYIGYSFTASGCVQVTFSVETELTTSGRLYPASGVYANSLPISGQVFLASGSITSGVIVSGVFVSVPIASISGVFMASGMSVLVPPATLSGVVANSGLTVIVPVGSISGVSPVSGAFVNSLPVSGQVYLASGSVTSGVIVSGIFVTATASPPASGSVYLASGSFLFGSGTFFLASGSVTSGVISSGIFVNGSFSLASGALSGQQVTLTSGQSYIASGINVTIPPSSISGVTVNSGLFVTVPIASISGAIANSGLFVSVPPTTLSGIVANSGLFVNSLPLSGQVFLASGSVTSGVISSGIFVTASVSIASGALSGQQVTLVSGQSYTASGINAVVPSTSLSGVTANSGLFVNVPIGSISGNFSVVPAASLSGVVANSGLFVNSLPLSGQVFLASGSVTSGVISSGIFVTAIASIASGAPVIATLFSGQVVSISSGQLSGQQVTLTSGQSYTASGIDVTVPPTTMSGVFVTAGSVLDKSGYTLTASGLDTITIEVGLNMRQAMSLNAAVLAGQMSGAGTNTIRFAAAGVPGTVRLTDTPDQSGNRMTIVLNPPT